MIPLCPEHALTIQDCQLHDLTGIYLVGQPMAWQDLNTVLAACLVVFAVAWGLRAVSDHIRGRR